MLAHTTSGHGTGQPSVTLTSAYNAEHSRTSLSDNLSSAGITTYVYDSGQRLTTITTTYGGTAGPQVVVSYDPANRITSESRTIGTSGTAVATSFSYDNANRQTTITDQVTGGAALATIVYSYDNANRVTSETDAEGTASFTYDNANELTGVTGSRSESYTYDLNGNRTGTGYTTGTDNEQTHSPGITYTYDNAGNMITANNGTTITTYTYDYRNRLTEVTQGGTVIATYTYDALNDRIGIKDNGTQTWTVYDGTHPYADFNGSGTLQERYLSGPGAINGTVVDELLARTSSGGATAWYLTDKLGSVRDIVNSSGTQLDHVVYDSFGNVLSETNASNGDRFKYAGMEYDPVTGLYYDRARYYSPTTGRFEIRDPKGFAAHDADLYRYVGNSAPNGTDPDGLDGEQPPLPPIPTAPDIRPGPGWEWKGPDAPGGPLGGWKGPDGGSLHWHDGPHGPLPPHWDWVDPYGNKYRHVPDTGKWYPDEKNNPNKPQPYFPPGTLEAAGYAAACMAALYFSYRVARLAPSLLPPLWWTIPPNVAIP